MKSRSRRVKQPAAVAVLLGLGILLSCLGSARPGSATAHPTCTRSGLAGASPAFTITVAASATRRWRSSGMLSESGRLRQARALAQALPADGPIILGGDLTTWFGYRDAAYRELAARLPLSR